MRVQPPDFGLGAQPLKEPPCMLSLGYEDPLLNSQDARLCVLKFIGPSPPFLARMEGMRPRHSRNSRRSSLPDNAVSLGLIMTCN